MATTNNENNTNATRIDLPDLDKNSTNTKINKYIETQVHKVLNIDQNTLNNLDNIMEDAVPIWNLLGLTEQEYIKKFCLPYEMSP